MLSKTQILERERRWTLVAGIASVAGVALIVASLGDSVAGIRPGDGLADRLVEIDAARGRLIGAAVLQAAGWILLLVPLLFLFRAAAARSNRVRGGLAAVIIAAPLMIGFGGLIGAGAVLQAADEFAKGPTPEVTACLEKAGEPVAADEAEEKSDSKDGKKPRTAEEKCWDDAAHDARRSAALAPLETGLGLAGLLGFTISVVYTSLWAMRTGLLTRFWGSLGIALGAAFVLFTMFTLIWFIYVGLLLAGWVPGGRPPAWAAGEAVEPPPPGSGGGLFGRAPAPPPAAGDEATDEWGEPIEGDSTELSDAGEAPTVSEDGRLESPPVRKRKKRDG